MKTQNHQQNQKRKKSQIFSHMIPLLKLNQILMPIILFHPIIKNQQILLMITLSNHLLRSGA